MFSRSHAPIDGVVLVEERHPDDPDCELLTWVTAFEQVPADAACTVVDSLEAWADRYAEQAAFAHAVPGHGASVKLVLAGTNAAGDVEGVARLRGRDRAGHALVRPQEVGIELVAARGRAAGPATAAKRSLECGC